MHKKYPVILDEAQRAELQHVIAGGTAPAGHARWSLRLLADKLVELEVVEAVSYQTVRRVLKKTNLSHG